MRLQFLLAGLLALTVVGPQAPAAPGAEHRPRHAEVARRRRHLGEPRDGLPRLQSTQGLEDAGRGQHAAGPAALPAQVDDDGADPPRQRVEVQGVGTISQGGELRGLLTFRD